MMTPKINAFQAKPGYRLYVKFQNGSRRILNMAPYLNKGIFKELRDERYFKKVRIVWGGLQWPHQQDLSADTLYYRGTAVKKHNKSAFWKNH